MALSPSVILLLKYLPSITCVARYSPAHTPRPEVYAYQTTCYFSLWLWPAETRAYNQNNFVTKMDAAFR